MSFLSGLGLPSSLTSVVGLAVGMYIFKTASSSMDPAMAQWTPQFLAYAGDLIALVASQLAAAYAGVKAIEAAVHFDKGFYYVYAGASSTGNLLGLWELLLSDPLPHLVSRYLHPWIRRGCPPLGKIRGYGDRWT